LKPKEGRVFILDKKLISVARGREAAKERRIDPPQRNGLRSGKIGSAFHPDGINGKIDSIGQAG
jgi:hypothetical protein